MPAVSHIDFLISGAVQSLFVPMWLIKLLSWGGYLFIYLFIPVVVGWFVCLLFVWGLLVGFGVLLVGFLCVTNCLVKLEILPFNPHGVLKLPRVDRNPCQIESVRGNQYSKLPAWF